MCALFIGPKTVPTRDNIRELKPVLVSKSRVEIMLRFLLEKNPYYVNSGVRFSQQNMDDLFPENLDSAFPSAIEICCLDGDRPATDDTYADRGMNFAQPSKSLDTSIDDGTLVLEAVGYSVGEKTPTDQRNMKAAAIAWCLDKKNFIKMQTGSNFITDCDPGLLTFTFPGLDPWGIGGFHKPNRMDLQHLPFERQVKNMLLQHDRIFQRDPNFAYVCWNIIQKKEVNRHVAFRTNASSQASIVSDIELMQPVLTDLMRKWDLNPNAKPSTTAEKRAVRTLNRLKLIAKDLKGSSGYKQCRRNEIRAMMKKMATPALFMTINLADICDPLLGAMGGINPGEWAKMLSSGSYFDTTLHLKALIRTVYSADVVAITVWWKRKAAALCIVTCLYG
ncbi:hypothetical protein B0H13DRAFT_2235550 [Mycena leptocephala]|nr:hypothetical protein B0H13DRAFT_2235550 [Mycena leptocephala]